MLAMIEAQATANADLIIGHSPYPAWVWADQPTALRIYQMPFPPTIRAFRRA
jgi:hypothetical protein